MKKVIILKPNASGKSAFVQVVQQFGVLTSVVATGNILVTAAVTKGQEIELPEGTTVTTRVSESVDEATGETKSCTWVVLA